MEVRDYIALADNLRTERAAFEGGWDEMRRIIMPRATGNAHPDSVPDNGGGLEHSDVANNSLKKLASAHLTYITPLDRRWSGSLPFPISIQSCTRYIWTVA